MPLHITKLDHHLMIFGCPQMKKHKILFDIINDSISISPKYYSHPRALQVLVSTIPRTETEIIFIATQQDVLSNQILKKGLTEKINDFLKTPEKILKKNG